jgi:hypothetical protein
MSLTRGVGRLAEPDRLAGQSTPGESPPGTRLRRRRWRDPRLAVGVLLVVASALGVLWVVSAADHRVMVWAANDDIAAGSPVTADRMVQVAVQVPDLSSYWLADDQLPDSAVATHDLASGELLSRAGVETTDAALVRVVTLPVLRNQMPADLGVGGRVDVYVVERTATGGPSGPPELVLRDAIVASVDSGAGAFGGSSLEVGVALSVPEERVPDLLDAQARGTLTLVDVPVTVP